MFEAEKRICAEDSARQNMFCDLAEFGPVVLPSSWLLARITRINDIVFFLILGIDSRLDVFMFSYRESRSVYLASRAICLEYWLGKGLTVYEKKNGEFSGFERI